MQKRRKLVVINGKKKYSFREVPRPPLKILGNLSYTSRMEAGATPPLPFEKKLKKEFIRNGRKDRACKKRA
jgi:hypothetical protein